jgi:hypothetical protein
MQFTASWVVATLKDSVVSQLTAKKSRKLNARGFSFFYV